MTAMSAPAFAQIFGSAGQLSTKHDVLFTKKLVLLTEANHRAPWCTNDRIMRIRQSLSHKRKTISRRKLMENSTKKAKSGFSRNNTYSKSRNYAQYHESSIDRSTQPIRQRMPRRIEWNPEQRIRTNVIASLFRGPRKTSSFQTKRQQSIRAFGSGFLVIMGPFSQEDVCENKDLQLIVDSGTGWTTGEAMPKKLG